MSKQNGILYVVFDEEYDKIASHAVVYSRKFTDLPIQVLTNLPSNKRNSKWLQANNVTFTYFNLPVGENRRIKTSMINYSIFDLTLYLDCDSVIQRNGIDGVFHKIGDKDLLLNLWGCFGVGEKIFDIYKKMMLLTKVNLPLRIYNGAFICFRKNQEVRKFFDLWNSYWKMGGAGREMPALACAVKNSGIGVVEVTMEKDKMFGSGKRHKDVLVQHEYGPEFFNIFGLPKFKSWKPFDKKGCWKKVCW